MKIRICCTLLLVFSTLCAAQQTADSFYKFNDCQASSTYSTGTSGASEFDAHRAIQPGTGYYCSAGHHADDEEVSWTGILASPANLKGVKIRWAYAPEEVKIAVSPDGLDFHVAVPYKRTPSNDVSFDESIFFEHPETAKAVTISMRKAIHDYFGINDVSLYGTGESLMALFSGITSPGGEMCLQVEGGKYNLDGAEVVLDYFSTALAGGDGRHLFKVNDNAQLVHARSNPQKCVIVQGGNTEGGGKIVMSDCLRALEEADSRSNWLFEANSQLRLQKAGAYCLSQKNVNGNAAGVGDVVRTLGATAKSSSNADENHGADKAVDRDTGNYWASGAFEDDGEHVVTLDIDLGKVVKLTRIRVDWEYPALSFAVLTSPDGQAFAEVSREEANPSNATLGTLGGQEAQYVRIEMLRPHPRYAKSGDKYLYGIREVEVFANRLQSIVTDCREAAKSDDARDKYFVEYMTEFDPVLADTVASMGDDVISRTKQLSETSKKLEDLSPQMESCLSEKKQYGERMHKATASSADVASQLEKVTNLEPNMQGTAGLIAGDSAEVPAEDCYVIKGRDPYPSSGFYWLEPKCATEPIRAYCDMKTATSLYVWNGNPVRKAGTLISKETLNSIQDVRLHCAEMGLEPLALKSAHQLKSVENALHQMGYMLSGKGAIPLAFDYGCLQGRCSGRFHDLLDGATDVTSLVLSKATPDTSKTAMGNTVGLGLSGSSLSVFDIGSTDIAAIVCSTNTLEGESELPHIDIACETTANGNDAFAGTTDTNIVVECPPGCEEDNSLEVYGSGGVYADSSSICRAAIHAGLIRQGGLVNVALESGRQSYEGSKNNGVDSRSMSGKSHRSIRLGPIAKDCPIDEFENQPSSFLEESSTTLEMESATAEKTANEKQEDVMLDASTAAVIGKTLTAIDELHGIDPYLVVTAEEAAAEVIAEARKKLKPAETLQEEQGAHALQLYSATEDLANRLYEISGSSYTTLEELSDRLKDAYSRYSEGQGFSSFKLQYQGRPFDELFEVKDTLQTTSGPSSWGYTQSSVAGHKSAIGQSSKILGKREAKGTFAALKNHHFYDTIFTSKFYARGSGSVGFAFRMRDTDNMYLLELNQMDGCKRLLKIVDGDVERLDERDDGGYIQGKWFDVRIETTQGKIKICVGEEGTEPVEVFSVYDERFMSGTIGFYTSGMDGVFFDDVVVEAKKCVTTARNPPPAAPRCSHFKESYFGSVQSIFEKLDPGHETESVGRWEYKDNVGGRRKVLAQLNGVQSANELGTNIMLKGHRLCKDGYMSFDFFPECPNGAVGGVFRYTSPGNYQVVEVTPSELRVRSVVNGSPTTIARKQANFNVNAWHTIHLNFEGPTVWVTLKGPNSQQTSLTADELLGGHAGEGRVGLTAYNCDGVAFDRLQVSPFETEQTRQAAPVVPHEKRPWHTCSETVHLLQRRDECHSMLHHEPQFRQVACAQAFCSECCHYHTSLLKPVEHKKCEATCHGNDNLAKRLEDNFINMLTLCLEGEGSAFEHCEKGDSSCQLEACHFCCISSEGVSDVADAPVDLIQGAAEREVAECKYQCSSKFPLVQ